MLEQFIIIIHIIAAVAVVALILLQQGKGADMGASFGSGASQTVLGVQGSGNLLTHTTAILVTVFFITSLSLGYFAKQKTIVDAEKIIVEEVVPASSGASEVPAAAPAPAQAPAADAGKVAPTGEIPE
jgi:preprotein translocase subunit SecG